MKKTLLALLLIVLTTGIVWAVSLDFEATKNYKLRYDASINKYKWRGVPDANYVWEGDSLAYEREVIDEEGNPKIVTTRKKPIEIIADFNANSEVYGKDKDGKIERAAVKKFGGSLKGFVWLDNVSGGGEVVLPFTAKHIFVAKGNRLNPELTEISTDPNQDNFYDVNDGKTHVYVKSFSGVGGAAGSPGTLIAHYKMNEDTASDNDELVTNGAAPTDLTGWTQSPGTQWSIVGNKFQGAGDSAFNFLYQDFGVVLGRKYKFSYEVTDNSLVGGAETNQLALSSDSSFGSRALSSAVATHTYYLTATVEATANNQLRLYLSVNATGGTIDLDNISIQLLAVEDSSGNDHDGLLQEDTDAAHVAGKINGAFDFDGSGDYLLIPDHDDFTPALTPFSISAWVYMHDATRFSIASKGIYNTDGEWRLWVDGNDKIETIQMDESVTSCFIGRNYGTAITSYENRWIHLVVTYDGGKTSASNKIYFNGVRVDDTDSENNAGSFIAVENLTHNAWIGRYDTSEANGLIDNTMIFSVELSPDDVTALYNNGFGTEIPAELDVDRRNLRARRRN